MKLLLEFVGFFNVCEVFIVHVWDDVQYFQCCRISKIT